MNVLKPLLLPQYLFRPRQVLLRLKRAVFPPRFGEFEMVRVPWGASLRVRPTEAIGANIWWYGIFDLLVSETIHRLLDPGETALDIGANIGQMTSLMQHKAGSAGRVIAFEPHPELFAELKYNICQLPGNGHTRAVELHMLALSDKGGEAVLDMGPTWSANRGMSRLLNEPTGNGRSVKVQVARLDEILDASTSVGVCKIDVEGHEMAVFRGAERLLNSCKLRDIVFEELGAGPGPVHDLLARQGYAVFAIRSQLMKPRLLPLDGASIPPGTEYLATREPERALQRFSKTGWKVLKRVAL